MGLCPDWTFPADSQVTPGLLARDRARSSQVAECSRHDGKKAPGGGHSILGQETKEHESEGELVLLLTQDEPPWGAGRGCGVGGCFPTGAGGNWVFLTLRSATTVSLL